MPRDSQTRNDLMSVIEENPGIDRKQLAGYFNRPYLNTNDLAQLERLIQEGKVVSDRVQTGITWKFVYYPG